VPYALLVTVVLFGKHIDKIEADTKLGVRTLPCILGEARARLVGQWLMILFYPLTLLARARRLGRAVGAPRRARHPAAARRAGRLPPAQAGGPAPGVSGAGRCGSVGAAFVHTRRAGGLLTLGLLLNALLPIQPAAAWL
jgi:1,4-dihydroxy-2-naphthoate octaprenyltransferase